MTDRESAEVRAIDAAAGVIATEGEGGEVDEWNVRKERRGCAMYLRRHFSLCAV